VSFVETLDPIADDVFSAIRVHPMVSRLGEGTLSEAPFRRWVRQDYYYLIEYARVLGETVAVAPTVTRMQTFASLLSSTLETEMELHREYAAAFGIDVGSLEATTPSPTTRAYTDFLVRTARTGSFGDAVVVLLACEWGFNTVARQLQADGLPDHDRYAEWIETYADEEFTELVERFKRLLEAVAEEATSADRERYRGLFWMAAQYEYLFWDAAWTGEEWPVTTRDEPVGPATTAGGGADGT
jgi:thiaminase/transcriptional activator TenA